MRHGLTRRTALAAPLALAACRREPAAAFDGGWLGGAHERGHRLREAAAFMPDATRRCAVAVVGAGVAGLAAARALAARRHRRCAALRPRRFRRRQRPRPHDGRHGLPARRALPAAAGTRGARGQRMAARARSAAHGGRAHRRRRAPSLPQSAGAALGRGSMARGPAAAGGARLGARASVPMLLTARGASFAPPALRDPEPARRLGRRPRRTRRRHVCRLARRSRAR